MEIQNQTPELSAKVVANAFVTRYYAILHHCPENVHKFYQESSLLGWPGPDDAISSTATLQGINEKIMSLDFKGWPMEIKSVDAQESLEGGVIVVVTGLIEKDNLRKNFSQTFFLAEQEKGYYVLNDIFKSFDVCESISDIAIHDGDGNNRVAPFTNDPVDEIQNGKELSGLSVIKETVAEVSVSKPSLDPRESLSKPPVTSGESLLAAGEPVSNVKDYAQKLSYASMVAKEGQVTARVSPNDEQQSAGPPAPKSSTLFASNNLVLPNKPKVSMLRNEPPVQARSIYIGGLPYSVTKGEVLNIIKQFGQVRRSPDSIQIRTREDGFCCGFVEFESLESVHLAIEARYVTFGEKEAYITYKRSSNPGRNSREKFPGRDGFQKRNFRGRDNGDKGQFTAPRHNKQADHSSNERMQWQRKAA